MKKTQIDVGELELHVVEHGEGEPVLFCHGFPDVWRGWRQQMEAVAQNGYRAIAIDMRGYGRSSAPKDAFSYTPFHTVGDLVKLLNILQMPEVTIVGHDFGASVAWNAAMMRPDIFTSVFCLSVPFLQPGDTNFIEQMRQSGKHFYMLDQMKPEAADGWSNAKVTIPGFRYWSSGSPAPEDRWDPFDAVRSMYRKAPLDTPSWADAEDLAYTVEEFERTGFQPALNYYRSIEPFFALARPFYKAQIRQPAFFLYGEEDGVARIRKPTEGDLRGSVPGLKGFVALPGVGHWPQHEANEVVNEHLLAFLRSRT